MPITVVTSRDGQAALGIEELADAGSRMSRKDVLVRLRLQPKGTPTRIVVWLDPVLLRQLDVEAAPLGLTVTDLTDQIVLEALGNFLDEKGPPDLIGVGEKSDVLNADREAKAYFAKDRSPPASDEEALAYMAGKVYWAWRYGMPKVEFGQADARRLHLPSSDIARLALAGDGTYWTRDAASSLVFAPTARLLGEYPAGAFPGMQRPLIERLGEKLSAPRYAAARDHYERCLGFIDGEARDLESAVKEASAAVAAVARRVRGVEHGTLGESIEDLRASGVLSPALAKSLQGLWEFSSNGAGLRSHEAIFAVNLAASAILLLLDLDSDR